jgi:hypothetical protein
MGATTLTIYIPIYMRPLLLQVTSATRVDCDHLLEVFTLQTG